MSDVGLAQAHEVAASEPGRGELLHILGTTFGVAVAVGAMIGVGILRAPSLIATDVPSVAVIMALWSVALGHALLEANVIAELCTALPSAGGPYVWVYRAFGEIGGLAVGWTLWVQRAASTAALSIAFADFFGLLSPWATNMAPAIAVAMQVALFGTNLAGLRNGRVVQEVTSFLKALALLAFCLAAFFLVRPTHDLRTHAASVLSWTGIVAAYQLIVGAYSGWYDPTFFSEEARDRGRSLPRVMAIGLFATAFLYVSVNGALLRVLGTAAMAGTALPFTSVLAAIGGTAAATGVTVFALVSVSSCANAGAMSAPRVLLALSRDRLLPGIFQTVNRGGCPSVATIATAVAAIVIALTGSFKLAFGLIATLQSAAFILVILSLFVLRKRDPVMARPFRAIAYPWLPGLVLAIDAVLFAVFLTSNRAGAIYAVIFWLLCIPFAVLARRARGAITLR